DLCHPRPGNLPAQIDSQLAVARLCDPTSSLLPLHDTHHAGATGVQTHAARSELRPDRPAPAGADVAQARLAARLTEQAGPRDSVERPPGDGPAAADEGSGDAGACRSRPLPGAGRLIAPGAGS